MSRRALGPQFKRQPEERPEPPELETYTGDLKKWVGQNREYLRGQEAVANRTIRRGLGGHGVSELPPAQDWSQPSQTVQHGPYTVGKFTGGIAAFHGDQPVGRLIPHNSSMVQHIEVHPAHRRKGIATAMFRMAKDVYGPQFTHSGKRSEQGDAWSRAVGD